MINWTKQVKRKPSVSVADYYIAATTPTAAFQAAIAALPASGGVLDARGMGESYTLTATLTIGKNVTVELGAATITTSALPVFRVTDTGASIKGAMAKLVVSGSSGAAIKAGVTAGAAQIEHLLVEGLWIYGAATTGTVHGIEADGVWDSVVRRCRIDTMSGDGILISDATPGGLAIGAFLNHIEDNKIIACAGSGVHLKAVAGSSVTTNFLNTNWIYGNGTNVFLEKVAGSVYWTMFESNSLEASTGDGLKIVGAVDVWLKSGCIEGSAGYGINRDTAAGKLKIDDTHIFSTNVLGDIKPVAAGGSASMRYDAQTVGLTSIQPAGWALQHHIGPFSEGDVYELGVNCQPINATDANLDDVSLGGLLFRISQATGHVSIYTVTAGANPRTLTLLFEVDNTGKLFLPLLPAVAPPSGGLYYDPGAGNVVKYVP